ncbi:hypothetical protein B0G77_8848 [Paraburkholderia sp. BL10I2N1]|nr:hypothetical protein B0G77_8848 [Paraburkholderia sp. BL10I2N1]
MKLTYPLLLNAKPQDKPYKIRDRDSMYLRVSVSGSKVWKFDYRLGCPRAPGTIARSKIATAHSGWPSSPAEGLDMSWSPRHLLPFHKALADHLVDRRFDEARRDRLAMTVAVPVVHDRALVVLEIADEFLQWTASSRKSGLPTNILAGRSKCLSLLVRHGCRSVCVVGG